MFAILMSVRMTLFAIYLFLSMRLYHHHYHNQHHHHYLLSVFVVVVDAFDNDHLPDVFVKKVRHLSNAEIMTKIFVGLFF